MKKKKNLIKKILIVLASLVIGVPVIVVGLLVYWVMTAGPIGQPSQGSISEKPYACGLFGDKLMLIDRRYVYFTTVNYQGVNYWTPDYGEINAKKGCDDQIQSVDFSVRWPEMTPHNAFDPHESAAHLNIHLGQRGPTVLRRMDETREFFDYSQSLVTEANGGALREWGQKTLEEIVAAGVFNHELGLYEVLANDGEGSRYVIYWQEMEDKGIPLLITCNFFKLVEGASCHLNTNAPEYGDYTSRLKLSFEAELLPYWKELVQDSLQLINSFAIPSTVLAKPQE